MSKVGPQTEAQSALIHLMVAMSAADETLRDSEFRQISLILQTLPVFDGFDRDRLGSIAAEIGLLLDQTNGIDTIIEHVATSVPRKFHETAYALAVEIAASDRFASQPELRLLEMIRDRLDLDPLAVAAIERSARVRYRLPD
ncbi:tellurite resistance TerB family protein [Consotaella salsifontis]|uniref:Tellurite resistance protein TerB n=1 Tax=Consotaella salsifontis TaxID=1365950 RepID=A0A1T4T3V3_9HYPH|nr:tellurite resistance TerB family protein [Consotaella salsifontis]SKA34818.1 Tellurite resistance protein TerB [Consotaella salsifontis]